jgi:hypothetical protein
VGAVAIDGSGHGCHAPLLVSSFVDLEAVVEGNPRGSCGERLEVVSTLEINEERCDLGPVKSDFVSLFLAAIRCRCQRAQRQLAGGRSHCASWRRAQHFWQHAVFSLLMTSNRKERRSQKHTWQQGCESMKFLSSAIFWR